MRPLPYDHPGTRLPGAGGAPEIATHARETFVVLKQSPRTFVKKLDFRTSAGFMEGSGARARTVAPGSGPQVIITDLGILKPAPESEELQLVTLFDGVTLEAAIEATGWPLKVANTVEVMDPPTEDELKVLRDLNERTRLAHNRQIKLPI